MVDHEHMDQKVGPWQKDRLGQEGPGGKEAVVDHDDMDPCVEVEEDRECRGPSAASVRHDRDPCVVVVEDLWNMDLDKDKVVEDNPFRGSIS